jgi:hypothetical protein
VQLDRTRIAVRERSGIEILDMALHVVRAYFRPWWQATLLGALPFALINIALLWGLWVDPDEDFPWCYAWLMSALVVIEAPWATAILTMFLGAAVFEEGINVRKALQETWSRLPQMVWCQGIVRGVVPAIACVALARWMDAEESHWVFDGFFLSVIGLWSICLRAFRPFINEIVLLERNPLRARSAQAITAGKRSKYLHEPSGGDLVVRWMGAALVGTLIASAFTLTMVALIGMLFGYWQWGWFMLLVGMPLVFWLTAGYMGVVRFLNYLDLRIRHEGWEVELRLRAEAVRMTSKLT